MDSHEIERALHENAISAETVTTAAGQQKSHPLSEQIKVADRAAAIRARRRGQLGVSGIPIISEGAR